MKLDFGDGKRRLPFLPFNHWNLKGGYSCSSALHWVQPLPDKDFKHSAAIATQAAAASSTLCFLGIMPREWNESASDKNT